MPGRAPVIDEICTFDERKEEYTVRWPRSKPRRVVGKWPKSKLNMAYRAYNKLCFEKNKPAEVITSQWMAFCDTLESDTRKKAYAMMREYFAPLGEKYHGIHYHARKGKWEAKPKQTMPDGTRKPRIRTYATPEEAARAVDSFSHHIEKQSFPMNFEYPNGVVPIIEFPMDKQAAENARKLGKVKKEEDVPKKKKPAVKKKKVKKESSPPKKKKVKIKVKKESPPKKKKARAVKRQIKKEPKSEEMSNIKAIALAMESMDFPKEGIFQRSIISWVTQNEGCLKQEVIVALESGIASGFFQKGSTPKRFKITRKGRKDLLDQKISILDESDDSEDDLIVMPAENYLINEKGERLYRVEKILKHRWSDKKKTEKEFLVKWFGYPDSHNTWEPQSSLGDNYMLAQYLQELEKAQRCKVIEKEKAEYDEPTVEIAKIIASSKGWCPINNVIKTLKSYNKSVIFNKILEMQNAGLLEKKSTSMAFKMTDLGRKAFDGGKKAKPKPKKPLILRGDFCVLCQGWSDEGWVFCNYPGVKDHGGHAACLGLKKVPKRGNWTCDLHKNASKKKNVPKMEKPPPPKPFKKSRKRRLNEGSDSEDEAIAPPKKKLKKKDSSKEKKYKRDISKLKKMNNEKDKQIEAQNKRAEIAEHKLQEQNQELAEKAKMVEQMKHESVQDGIGLECPVCIHLMVEPRVINPCGHHGCEECLLKVFAQRRRCPMCQAEADPKLTKALWQKAQINRIVRRLPAHEQEEYNNRVREYRQSLRNKEIGNGGVQAQRHFLPNSRISQMV